MDSFWNEPDFISTCAFGLPIILRRNTMKAWCGYVGIPREHPYFGLSYSDSVVATPEQLARAVRPGKDVSSISLLLGNNGHDNIWRLDVLLFVHGGVTWAEGCYPLGPKGDPYWWFGFDTAHIDDRSPYDEFAFHSSIPGTYRNLAYVTREARRLAEQLADVK